MQIGDTIGEKYTLTRLLGEGGMGAVYEAHHEQLGKNVAIKLLHPALSKTSEVATRFIREAQAAAAIGHRSIIDVYDLGTEPDGTSFIVMELLDGESLGELLRRQSLLDVNVAIYIVAQVLSALHAAHAAGIVHRDLKPDNIFLVRTGQRLPDVKLLDFGISKMVDPANPDERLTRTGAVMGTPYYMSPEQAVGQKDLDHRVDIWAMGVILYECLTGKVPFSADNSLALLRMITDAPFKGPRDHRPDLSVGLEQVVLRAMNRNPDARFTAGAEMLSALLPLVEDRVADRISLPDGLDRAATLSGASASLDPDHTPTMAGSDEQDSTPTAAESDTLQTWEKAATQTRVGGRSRTVFITLLGVIVLLLLAGGSFVVWQSLDDPSPPPERSQATSPPESTPQLPHSAGAPETAVTSPTGGAGTPDAPQDAPTVTLTLIGIPDGATVQLGADEVSGSTLTLEQSSQPQELSVRLDGYRRWSTLVIPSTDQRITVSLQPVAPAAPPQEPPEPPSEERRAHRASTKTKRPQRPEPRPAPREPTRPRPAPTGDPTFDTTYP